MMTKARIIRSLASLLCTMALQGSASTASVDEAQWATVQDTNLEIAPGSPLDFSAWTTQAQDPSGHARMHCASLAWSPATGGFPDHQTASRYAQQLKRHGYNVVRFHYVEATLMAKRDEDFDFDPQQLDNWLFFLAELKRLGVNWVFDALSSDNGALGGVYPHRWVKKHKLKEQVYLNERAQQHWRELNRRLLTMVNPYTKVKVIADPALLGIILVNENGLNYLATTRQRWPDGLDTAFNAWLKQQGLNNDGLARKWKASKDASDDLDLNAVSLPQGPKVTGAKAADAQRFMSELEGKTAAWMSEHLRSLGFKGWITSYNNWPAFQTSVSRSAFDWVDMHAYHDESFAWSPGTSIQQTSSLGDGVRYARWLAMTRQKGKAFSVTEYGQPFWNQYRYEAGLTVPAMARLQGWNFACLHASGAIDLSSTETFLFKRQILPYGVGLDPIARAGETLAAAIMMRGDIRPFDKGLTLPLSRQAAFDSGGNGLPPDDISYLAWLTRVDLAITHNESADNSLLPPLTKWSAIPRLSNHVALLKRKGLLPGDNQSDVDKGIYQSGTGEVTLDTHKDQFAVNSPRTEALAARKLTAPIKLGSLTVRQLSGSGLLGLISLDGLALKSSQKILIVLASDAENTGMSFKDPGRKQLEDLGKLPARLRRITANLDLDRATPSNGVLTSLHLNGALGDNTPLTTKTEKVSVALDNFATSHGPTTFFLLTFNK